MGNVKHRKVVTYKDYFKELLKNQLFGVKEKIICTLELIEDLEKVPETYLKLISGTNGMYEIRVNLGSNSEKAKVISKRLAK